MLCTMEFESRANTRPDDSLMGYDGFVIESEILLSKVGPFMASTVFHVPCGAPSIKPLDCQSHVGLKPSPNLQFSCFKTMVKGRPTQHLLVVKASESSHGPIKKLGLSDAECEATVVAGNIPEAPPPPPKPASPAGTLVVPSLPLSRQPRCNRKSPALRASFQETNLSTANFVYPLFIHEGEEDTPIGAMPGCYRLGWRHGLVEEEELLVPCC